jgi:hypothetical protein
MVCAASPWQLTAALELPHDLVRLAATSFRLALQLRLATSANCQWPLGAATASCHVLLRLPTPVNDVAAFSPRASDTPLLRRWRFSIYKNCAFLFLCFYIFVYFLDFYYLASVVMAHAWPQ